MSFYLVYYFSLVQDTATCDATNINCEDPEIYNWILTPLLAGYMLVGNVLLLNLVIAVFT